MTAHQWKACSGEPLDLRGRDVFGGLDLSETKDLTVLVLIGSDIRDGTWHERRTFWLPSERLYDRASSDRIPYEPLAHARPFRNDAELVDFVRARRPKSAHGVRSAARHQAGV